MEKLDIKIEPFDSVTIVKPAPGSSKFFRDLGKNSSMTEATEEFYGVNEFGDQVLLRSNPYKSERFQGTTQVFGAEFNYSKGRWLIIDPEDITKKRELTQNSEVLNELVRRCRLVNDRKGHPDYGKFIEKADIFDRNDPFFTNFKMRYALDGGEAFIPSSVETNPLNVLILLSWIPRKQFNLGAAIPTARGVQVKYIIVDQSVEKKIKNQKRTLRNRAIDLFRALSDEQKLKIAIALGLVKKIKTDPSIVDEYLEDYYMDNETKSDFDPRYTKMEVFVNLVESGATEIEAHYAFNFGVSCGIIRYHNKAYNAFNQKLGSTIKEAVAYLMRPDNTMMNDIIDACKLHTLQQEVVKIERKIDTFQTVKEQNKSNEKASEKSLDVDVEEL